MNNEVKKTLRDLYLKEGAALFSNSVKLNAYLNDVLYAYGVEKNVLSIVIRGGYVSRILAEVKTEKDFPKAKFYVEHIVSQYGISRENATEAVESIIYAIHGKEPNIPITSSKTSTGGSGLSTGGSGSTGGNSSESKQKKKIWPWVVVAVIVIIIISNVAGNNSSNYFGGSTNTITETTSYVTTTNLTDLTYIHKDKNISVGNSTVTTNAGTQCSNYIDTNCPYAEITYPLNGNFDGLTATWALSEYGKNTAYKHSVEIFADGVSVYKSPTLTAGDVPVKVSANLNYCDALTIMISGVKGHAFLGDIQLTSSQSDRVYNDDIPSNIRSYTWLATLDDMGKERMIVWKNDWVETNTGSYLVSSITPSVESYSNTDIEEFKKNGSYIDYYIGGEYAELSGTCAFVHNRTNHGTMTIQIIADDTVVYNSPLLSSNSLPVDFNVNITNCTKIRIKFIPSGEGKWGYDSADFKIGNLKLYK